MSEDRSRAARRAEDYLLAGRLRDARALFDRDQGTDCFRPGAELALARLEVLENRLSAALPRLERLLSSQPALTPAWELLADGRYRRGELAQAAQAYRSLGRAAFAGHLERFGRAHPYATGGGGARIPWLRDEPLPVIQACARGRTLNLVLDTGAGDLLLDEAVAAQLAVTPVAEEAAEFAGGRGAPVRYGALPSLELGGWMLTDIPVHLMSLQALFAPWFSDCTIDGVLGTGLFARMPTALDFRARRLDLGDAVGEPGGASLALYLAGTHYPLVEARLPGGQWVLLFLDTGMAGAAVALAPSVARQTELLGAGAAVLGQGGGGAVAGQPVRLGGLQLNGTTYGDLDALVLEQFPIERRFGARIGGLLGHDFFRGRRLVLDFSRSRCAID